MKYRILKEEKRTRSSGFKLPLDYHQKASSAA